MAASPLHRLSRMDATGLFDAAASGRSEVLGVLDGRPVLVVDLDAPGGALQVPTGLPAVVVGASRTGQGDPGAVDVALSAGDALAPFVGVTDLDAAVDDLAARVMAAPLATVTLVQVLRAGAGLDVPSALVLESLAYATLQAGPEHRAWLASRPAPAARHPDDGPAVRVDHEGGALTVTLDRPARHNAFSTAVRDGLAAALERAASDPAVTEVHLRGAGPSFCSGGDLAEFGTTPDPATGHLVRSARSCARLLDGLDRPVTAHLHGHAIGAGIELAALADRVVAAPDTAIALPEVGLGLIPGAGGTASLRRRIGPARTAWLALSGAAIDPWTALDWGLVDEVP